MNATEKKEYLGQIKKLPLNQLSNMKEHLSYLERNSGYKNMKKEYSDRISIIDAVISSRRKNAGY
jgi:hypothetical protein